MSAQQTMAAMRRAAEEMNAAWVAYAVYADPDEFKEARRRLDRAMHTYEMAVLAHRKALAAMIDDPRHVRPPHGHTKGL